VYGERVEPGEIPRSLQEDAIFREGIDALRRLTQKSVLFKIAFNYHRGEIDVSPLLKEAPWLKECKVAGMEWNSASDHAMPKTREEICFGIIPTDAQGLGQYISLVVADLKRRNVPTVPCDIDTPTTENPEDDVLRSRLRALLDQVKSVMDKENKGEKLSLEEYELSHLVWSAYQYVRQYLLLAHFGYMAARYEDQLQPGDTIGLAIGIGHVPGVPQKAEQLKIPLAEATIVKSFSNNAVKEFMFEGAVPNGRITRQDLRAIAEDRERGAEW